MGGPDDVSTFAGDGFPANAADCDARLPGMQASLGAIQGIALGRGGLFITETGGTHFGQIAVGPIGELYVTEPTRNRVRRVGAPPMILRDNEYFVPGDGGAEVYIFDRTGRHLRTLNGFTGMELRHFAYDGEGRLASVSEVYPGAGVGGADVLRTTSVQRDGDGRPTALVGPDGHVTTLFVPAGGDGYLTTVTSPAGQTHEMQYDPDEGDDGLLVQLKRPNAVAAGSNDVYTFTYDDVGRLTRDANPVGGFTELERTAADRRGNFTVEARTAEGRVSEYDCRGRCRTPPCGQPEGPRP